MKTDADKGVILRAYRVARESAIAELLSSGFAEKIIALAATGFLGTGKQLADKLGLPTEEANKSRKWLATCGRCKPPWNPEPLPWISARSPTASD